MNTRFCGFLEAENWLAAGVDYTHGMLRVEGSRENVAVSDWFQFKKQHSFPQQRGPGGDQMFFVRQ